MKESRRQPIAYLPSYPPPELMPPPLTEARLQMFVRLSSVVRIMQETERLAASNNKPETVALFRDLVDLRDRFRKVRMCMQDVEVTVRIEGRIYPNCSDLPQYIRAQHEFLDYVESALTSLSEASDD